APGGPRAGGPHGPGDARARAPRSSGRSGPLACTEPGKMLSALWSRRGPLAGVASSRKLRLFVCACSRAWMTREPDPRLEEEVAVLEVAERHADGLATRQELEAVRRRRGTSWAEWTVAMPSALDCHDGDQRDQNCRLRILPLSLNASILQEWCGFGRGLCG